jgi:[ribosomal protein S5]-alanine N-acetyltransferase
MHLKTGSSLLRPWSTADTRALVRHANNPGIAERMRDGFPSPYTREDAERFIAMAIGDHQHIFLAIEVDGEAVGGIGVHLLEDVYHRSAELGYWLSEEYWGKGIVSDAVRTLLPIAFREHDIIRIQAGVFENNPASMKVLERCGFVLEAIHRKAVTKQGKTLDEHLYVIFLDEV